MSDSNRGKWVLSPRQDWLLIIAAPLWAAIAIGWLHYQMGMLVTLTLVGIYNIAHHLPTFLRVYGDRQLWSRFRYRLVLGPVIAYTCFMISVAFVIRADAPAEAVLYLLIFLAVWAPWHLMMQHYGFMRIYDRGNAGLWHWGAWMDWLLCVIWFTYFLTMTTHWLPDLLYEGYFMGLPILGWLEPSSFQTLEKFVQWCVIGFSVLYGVYILANWILGYSSSWLKLATVVTTFGIIYLTFVPNPVTQRLVPNWHWALGLFTLNAIHNTQYLAIVWKFNRKVVHEPGRSQRLVRRLFSSSAVAVVVYVMLCLMYGALLSAPGRIFTVQTSSLVLPNGLDSRWVLGAIMGLVFTSELMHYYFDGFIWKVRHRENRQLLGDQGQHASWGGSVDRWYGVAFRHLIYFGLPILILGITYWMEGVEPSQSEPIRVGLAAKTPAEKQQALVLIEKQLDLERKMLSLRQRSEHWSYTADLRLTRATLAFELFETGAATGEVTSQIKSALDAIERTLELPPPYAHRETPIAKSLLHSQVSRLISPNLQEMSRRDYESIRESLQLMLRQLEAAT